MFSYFILLSCSLLVAVAIYSYSARTLRAELISIEQMTLKNVQSGIDGRLREAEVALSVLALDDDIRFSVHSEDPFSGADTYLAFQKCQSQFTAAMTSIPDIKNIYLYSNRSEIMLSSRFGLNDKSKIPFEYYEVFGISEQAFADRLNQVNQRKYMLFPLKDKTEALFLYIPIYQSGVKHEGALIAEINLQLLRDYAASSLVKPSTDILLITQDNDHQILFTSNGILSDKVIREAQEVLSEGGVFTLSSGELLLDIHSQYNNWRYVAVTDIGESTSSLRHFRNRTVFFVMLFTFAGMLFSYCWSKWNYIPIKNLVDRIKSTDALQAPEKENELAFLEDSFNSLFEQNQDFSALLYKQRATICNNIWTRTLHGRIHSAESVTESLARQGLHLKGNAFAVVLIEVEDYGALKAEKGELQGAEEAMELAFVLIKNILEELLNDSPRGYVTTADRYIACIVNFNKATDTARKRLTAVLTEFTVLVNQHFQITVNTAVSDIKPSLYSINACYQQAQVIMDETYAPDTESIRTSESLNTEQMSQDRLSVHMLNQRRILLAALLAKDYRLAKTISLEMTQADALKNFELRNVRIRQYNMLYDYVLALVELSGGRENETYHNGFQRILRLTKTKNRTEYTAALEDIFSYFVEINKRITPQKPLAQAQEIKTYIRKNLADSNLTVTGIADAFSISVSHLSRIIQASENTGTHEYIQRERIEAAKKLLMETDLSISEISEHVGYNSYRTLNTIFKKIEGMTGSQYRNQFKQKK